jgi:hypothetical protein
MHRSFEREPGYGWATAYSLSSSDFVWPDLFATFSSCFRFM